MLEPRPGLRAGVIGALEFQKEKRGFFTKAGLVAMMCHIIEQSLRAAEEHRKEGGP